MEYSNALNDEKMSAIKAQRGIENMEELYRQIQESEQADDDEEGEVEGGAEGEGEREGGEGGEEEGGEGEGGQGDYNGEQ